MAWRGGNRGTSGSRGETGMDGSKEVPGARCQLVLGGSSGLLAGDSPPPPLQSSAWFCQMKEAAKARLGVGVGVGG